MTDLDPKIWENPTLGAAGAGPFLPEVEAQLAENKNAREEGREPRTVEYVHRYPKYLPSGCVPSVQCDVLFKDDDTAPVTELPGPIEQPPVAEEPEEISYEEDFIRPDDE